MSTEIVGRRCATRAGACSSDTDRLPTLVFGRILSSGRCPQMAMAVAFPVRRRLGLGTGRGKSSNLGSVILKLDGKTYSNWDHQNLKSPT